MRLLPDQREVSAARDLPNPLVLAHNRRRILHINVTPSSDRDGAQNLPMDEDSPAVEADAEGRSTTAKIQVMKSTTGHFLAHCIDDRDVIRCIMKSFTVRLPETLVADIEAESRGRKV